MGAVSITLSETFDTKNYELVTTKQHAYELSRDDVKESEEIILTWEKSCQDKQRKRHQQSRKKMAKEPRA